MELLSELLILAETALIVEGEKRTANVTPTGKTNQIIREVYEMLYDVLSLYKASKCYNYLPNTKNADGAWEYYESMIDKIRKHINVAFLGKRDTETFKKLYRIIDETEIFVKSFSVPGVVERWREINPTINYFDHVFDLIKELDKEGFEGNSFLNKFSFVPNEREIKMRNLYFYNKERKNSIGNLRYSEERIYQDELLNTLASVFEHDFSDQFKHKKMHYNTFCDDEYVLQ